MGSHGGGVGHHLPHPHFGYYGIDPIKLGGQLQQPPHSEPVIAS